MELAKPARFVGVCDARLASGLLWAILTIAGYESRPYIADYV